jgi:transposase-like protein
VATLLEEAEDDLLAFYSFPTEHWPKLRSTNPLERVHREIGRRTVVGIFPNDRSLIPARRQRRDRAERPVARRAALPQRPLSGCSTRRNKEEKQREEARELTRA